MSQAAPSPVPVAKPASVRYPDRDEADDIMRLMLLQAEENSMFDIDHAKLRFAMDRAFRFDRTILGVIGPKGGLRGGIMLFVGGPWYSNREVLQELFNFVHPEHRKSNYANDLIDFSKHLSDTMQLPLQIGVMSNHRTEAKVRLYRRKLTLVGASFTYNDHLGITDRSVPMRGLEKIPSGLRKGKGVPKALDAASADEEAA